MGAVGRWAAAGPERGLGVRGRRQVVIIISAFIHEKKILGTSTNKNMSRKHSPESIHHVPTPNVLLARGGPYPTVFPNIIEVFHCRRIRCLSFMINCLSFIVLYVFHSREWS